MSLLKFAPAAREVSLDLRGQEIKRILLAQALFRLGDTVLATPTTALMRQNIPKRPSTSSGRPFGC